MLKTTALHEQHRALGGRLIDFGGWDLPVQYSGVMQEHEACRNAAGLFDVSHMGEIDIEGEASEAFLNYLVTNNVAKLSVGQAQYTAMCHESGGIVDDLVIYRRGANRFLVVVNASNTDKDFKHILAIQEKFLATHSGGFKADQLRIANVSSEYTQIAIQGRKACEILQKATSVPLQPIKNYWFAEGTILRGISAIIARTGYTGEDGFEVYVPWNKGAEVWTALLDLGQSEGIKPCGLGARDTLRLEMKYPLYGNELTDQTLPLETGLGWVVKLDKGDFVGRAANLKAKEQGLKRALVGFKLLDKGIPRHGYAIFDANGEEKIGEVTSGTQSPSLKASIGIGNVPLQFAQLGSRFTVDIRGTKVPAETVATPFYKRPY